MKEFLLKARSDLKSDLILEGHLAAESLFDLAEKTLLEAHDDLSPSFCNDVIMMSAVVKEIVQHVGDYSVFQNMKEVVRASIRSSQVVQ